MINNIVHIFKDKGLVIVFTLSAILLSIFFGNLLSNSNHYFFGVASDGMQVYYNTWYHVLFDTEIFTTSSMNYPYQESVFFTGCNPLLTSGIKLFGLQKYTIGIINFSMLLSIPFAAICIYLIFKEYRVNYVFAAITAVAIAFLSPQIERLHGHYNLSYVFAIPLTIYLMLRFYKEPSFKISFYIAFSAFLLACTHMYLFMFSIAIITSIWLGLFFVKSFKEFKKMIYKYFFIQVMLPFTLIKILIFISNVSNDRTNSPFGFFDYYSNINGIFYPFGRVYEQLFQSFGLSANVNYEGVAFVGIIACLFICFLIIKLIYNVVVLKYKMILNITDDYFLNILLLVALVCLVFSFCIPFKYDGYHSLALKLDFIKQFRALGRFTWIFFYVINIISVIYISNLSGIFEKFRFKQIIMTAVFIGLSYDAYCNIKHIQYDLDNEFNPLSDFNNKLEENIWVNDIDKNQYQAVLPLPYFHVGSEMYSFPINNDEFNNACVVSLKTGLPMIGVYNSRISIKETYKSIQLIKEPVGKTLDIINNFKNNKDILLVVKSDLCNSYEKKILSYAKFILKTERFELYKLKVTDLKKYYTDYAQNIKEEFMITQNNLILKNGFLVTDTSFCFQPTTYQMDNNEKGFQESGSFIKKIDGYVTIFNDKPIYKKSTKNYTLSFWIKNLNEDVLPKTGIDIKATNTLNESYGLLYSQLMHLTKQIYGNWALIEYALKLQSADDKIEVILWNDEVKQDKYFTIDNLILRADTVNVYKATDSCIYKNNKIYFLNNFNKHFQDKINAQ